MTGSLDIWWQQILYFQNNYNVISYTLPEKIHYLKDATFGILSIIDQENIHKVILIGSSMGGYITQYLIKHYPERIDKAVLGNTFPPNSMIKKENDFKVLLLRILPDIVFDFIYKNNINKNILPASENSLLLKAFLFSLPITKNQFINRYNIVIDYFDVSTRKELEIQIPKLIIESNNDPLVPVNLRQILKEIYKEANVITLNNKGHFPYVNDAKNYNTIIEDFIKK